MISSEGQFRVNTGAWSVFCIDQKPQYRHVNPIQVEKVVYVHSDVFNQLLGKTQH